MVHILVKMIAHALVADWIVQFGVPRITDCGNQLESSF